MSQSDHPPHVPLTVLPSSGKVEELKKELERNPPKNLADKTVIDRAVDESGHQLAVFGRRGARPMNLDEQQRLYLRQSDTGGRALFMVSDAPDASRDLARKK